MTDPKHEPTKLSDFDATMIAEGVQDADEETTIRAWQHLIDTGLAWKLQGFFGRTATSLIERGICHAKEETTQAA